MGTQPAPLGAPPPGFTKKVGSQAPPPGFTKKVGTAAPPEQPTNWVDFAMGLAQDMPLPTIGGVVGRIVGGVTTGGNPAGMALGAAGGAGLGEYANEYLKRKGVFQLGTPPAKTTPELIGKVGIAAAGGPLQEASKIAGAAGKLPPWAAKPFTESQELARAFKIPLTPGQQGGSFSALYESLLRRSLGGGTVMRDFDIRVNKLLMERAHELGNSISATMSQRGRVSAGKLVQDTLKSVYDEMGTAYRSFLDTALFPQVGNKPINVTGTLRQTAEDLLGELEGATKFSKAMGSVDAVNKAISVLRDFANPYEVVKTGVIDPNTGVEITRKVARELTFKDAHTLRSLLYDLTHSGEINIGKGKAKVLTGSLHDAMTEAASKVDPTLATAFEKASSKFRQGRDLFENSLVLGLLKRKNPEAVLPVILSANNAGSIMENVVAAMPNKEANLQAIRKELWNELISKVTTEGVFVGDKLRGYLNKLGDEATSYLFGRDAAVMDNFADLLNKVELTPQLAKSTNNVSLLTLGQGAKAFNPVDMARAGVGAVASILGSLITLGPVGAKILSSKAVTESFLDIAQRPKFTVKMANRLIAAISAEAAKEYTSPQPTYPPVSVTFSDDVREPVTQ